MKMMGISFSRAVILFIVILSAPLRGQAEWKAAIPVELFTSQGCDSCPPADELLIRLAADETILPLAFHVDYWNHLGWQDVFSDKAFTDRQIEYAKGINSRKIYTPQIVVNGSIFLVGSDGKKVYGAINWARSNLDTSSVPEISYNPEESSVFIQVSEPEFYDKHKILYVIYDPRIHETKVRAGENIGDTLHNSHIVISLGEFAYHEIIENRGLKLGAGNTPLCESNRGLALIFQTTIREYPSSITKAFYAHCNSLMGQ